MTKRVLIAQHSTIPHYRVRFYELLEKMRPRQWSFDVAFDCRESDNPRIYPERVDWRSFAFPILDAPVSMLQAANKRLLWQRFLWSARRYDVLVTDTHLTNVSYPLVSLYRLVGKKRVYWGHIRNTNDGRLGAVREWGQGLKLRLIKGSDCFFAYTEAKRQEAIALGLAAERVVALNNTIDTLQEREAFLRLSPQREQLRHELGVAGKRVLLYVGRLIADKRVDFLVESFSALYAADARWHLFVVGGGPLEPLARQCRQRLGAQAVTLFGPLTDRAKLAPLYCASDLYFLPGALGLAPVQALCYDLPAVVFDLPTNGPEFAYLDERNSAVLPQKASAQDVAAALPAVYERFAAAQARSRLYPSVAHLTLENMARNFIRGINAVLGLEDGAREAAKAGGESPE